jgi:preprotein translocase SecE subunit
MTDKKKTESRSQSQVVEAKAKAQSDSQAAKRNTSATREEGKRESGKVAVAREEKKRVARQQESKSKGKLTIAARIRKNRFGRFILDAYYELRHKVTWPSFEQARNMTIAVILLSAVIGGLLFGLDFGLQKVFIWIISGHW